MTKGRSMHVAIIGGGPAGLMAAEAARAAGLEVDVYEAKGSVGRKFLLAGKGGLNLTHSEARDAFVARYGRHRDQISAWLETFDNDSVRRWARELGVETMIGTSARVFPVDLKAAPLLRRWLHRLRESGVRFHVNHRCTGWSPEGELQFTTPTGVHAIRADATVIATGGASWPELGSDGAWVDWLSRACADIAPLQPANCGFDVAWSSVFVQRFAGHPVKTVVLSTDAASGVREPRQGEFVISAHGIEGSAVYALSATLRDALSATGRADLVVDLAPTRDVHQLQLALTRSSARRSLTEHLRRAIGFDGVKTGLLYELLPREAMNDPASLATAIKSLRIPLLRPRPLAEAISTAGGVRFQALDTRLMLTAVPGVFCAGEMIDWEAPTGGYLLTACFASGLIAGRGAVAWLRQR
ncbi:TIGR03862 family flavoprotein [Steroidobacter sp.]|uniref:TIGR03862 family flavoprotein n=1 Tax=Steroidobacter sp. TaxID=1978227 RepID=UPI001A556DDF|nr:TIGR03862 family flavoprotein [Steroidobacter sp.]